MSIATFATIVAGLAGTGCQSPARHTETSIERPASAETAAAMSSEGTPPAATAAGAADAVVPGPQDDRGAVVADAAPSGTASLESPVVPDAQAAPPSWKARRAEGHPVAHALDWMAFEAQVSTPSWSAPAEHPEATRDDDLLTAWTCAVPEVGPPCALAVSFGVEADVRLLRLFGSVGATRAERQGFRRVRTIRIHTGQGWLEAAVEDWWDHQYVILEPGVRTRWLALEIRETYGDAGDVVGIADLEIFGPEGPRRAPLAFDAGRVIVRGSPAFWGGGREGTTPENPTAPTWIEIRDDRGGARRWWRGTAVLAQVDGYALVERSSGSSCPGAYMTQSGTMFLAISQTRALINIGALGGVGGGVWTRREGPAFATSGYDPLEDAAPFRIVAVANDRLEFSGETLASWEEFERYASDRGFVPAEREPPVPGCREVSGAAARGLLRGPAFAGMTDEDYVWTRCDAGEGRSVLFLADVCSGGMESPVVVVDAAGEATLPRPDVRGEVHLRRLDDGTLLIAVNDASRSNIYRIGPDGGLELAYENAAFRLWINHNCQCNA